jgi:molybdenum cofactor cytidylyltransferase
MAGPLGPVSALVLAAGQGRRAWPHDKLLTLDRAGEPMVARSVRIALRSRADRVLVALGHRAAAIEAALRPLGTDPKLRLLQVPDHKDGMAHSLRHGIQAAERLGCAAAIVCLADMPLVAPATIDRLIRAWAQSTIRPHAVLPVWRGERGHPVLWDRERFAALLALDGDRGARAVLQAPGTRRLEIDAGDPGVVADFDTPDRLHLFTSMGGDGDEPLG